MGMLATLKGLPLTYNRDLQEDKELLFDTARQHQASLEILEALLRHVSFKPERMKAACAAGHMDATAVAEYLVRRGLPFREAHHAAGTLVKAALRKDVPLSALSDRELRAAHPRLDKGVRAVLGAAAVVRTYASEGSANPKLVRRAIVAWRKRLKGG
jgi:argininosuccinate lyase